MDTTTVSGTPAKRRIVSQQSYGQKFVELDSPRDSVSFAFAHLLRAKALTNIIATNAGVLQEEELFELASIIGEQINMIQSCLHAIRNVELAPEEVH
jgi:hypothetical protein